MANKGKSSVIKMVGRTCTLVTLSAFLGFGLSACSGDSGSDEAVQVSDGGDSSAEAAAPPAEEAAPANADAEQPAVATDESAPPAVDEAPPAPEAEVAENGPAVEEVAPPPEAEAMDASTGTVNAELPEAAAQHAKEAAAAAVPQAPAPEAPAAFSKALSEEPVADGNTISSPGAAKYVATAHTGHHSGKHSHHAAEGGADAGNTSQYVVESGDSLSLIAKKIYGSAGRWPSLAQLNSINEPYTIFPGDALSFDAGDPQAQEFVKSYHTSMKTLVVKKGDSLSKLALQLYSNAAAWKRLLSFNRDKIRDPNLIEIGMTLAYMEDGSHNPIAEDGKDNNNTAGKTH